MNNIISDELNSEAQVNGIFLFELIWKVNMVMNIYRVQLTDP